MQDYACWWSIGGRSHGSWVGGVLSGLVSRSAGLDVSGSGDDGGLNLVVVLRSWSDAADGTGVGHRSRLRLWVDIASVLVLDFSSLVLGLALALVLNFILCVGFRLNPCVQSCSSCSHDTPDSRADELQEWERVGLDHNLWLLPSMWKGSVDHCDLDMSDFRGGESEECQYDAFRQRRWIQDERRDNS